MCWTTQTTTHQSSASIPVHHSSSSLDPSFLAFTVINIIITSQFSTSFTGKFSSTYWWFSLFFHHITSNLPVLSYHYTFSSVHILHGEVLSQVSFLLIILPSLWSQHMYISSYSSNAQLFHTIIMHSSFILDLAHVKYQSGGLQCFLSSVIALFIITNASGSNP